MSNFRERIPMGQDLRHSLQLGCVLAVLPFFMLGGAGTATAQQADVRVWSSAFVGTDAERYLRVLQVVGAAGHYPWSIRGFSPSEIDSAATAFADHPWARRSEFGSDSRGGMRLALTPARLDAIYNTAFPYGDGPSAVWAGRGATVAVRGGAAARYGPLSITLAPEAHYAENREFELRPNGLPDEQRYANPVRPTGVDLPQRFGDEGFWRAGLGQSTVRVDYRSFALGVSTASQHWGPTQHFPIILGSNAPGYAHVFAGTAHPVDLFVGRLHGRMVWGRLEQSVFSPVEGHGSRRLMAGTVAVFQPRFAPTLEIGGSRFFHMAWPADGLGAYHLGKPLESFLKINLREGSDDDLDSRSNQLASVFVRWVLPASGLEVYGEYGREDHNWDVRDLLQEPDHSSAFALGTRKVWQPRADRWLAFRAEVVDARESHLREVRNQARFYTHSKISQGHTHRGRLLGSPAVFAGGAGAMLGLDYYHPAGRLSAEWRREQRAGEDRSERQPTRAIDVVHALGGEALIFTGRADLVVGAAGIYNFNRDFRSDEVNLKLNLGLRLGL
jgi:hypothetical protein